MDNRIISMYKVELSDQVLKDLNKIPKNYAKKIFDKIKMLENYKVHNLDIKKLSGYDDVYRLRVGEYRVIYEIHNNKLSILVVKIKIRGNAYD